MDKSVRKTLGDFSKAVENAKANIYPELLSFLMSLGMEGERSAVVLGAERVHVAIEHLLKSFLHPSPNKEDKLFHPDGALGSFAKKTEMAFRLGLIDAEFKQAVDLVRKLRNDFAHAVKVESLSEQRHASRVQALEARFGDKDKRVLEGFYLAFAESGEKSKIYLGCIMLLLVKLELARYHTKPPEILLPVKITYSY